MEYAFKVTETGEIVKYDMKISEYDSFNLKNPHLERSGAAPPGFMDGDAAGASGFKSKLDGGFQEVLSKVAEAHPASELAKNTDYNRRSIKEIKTREIMTKHAQKTGHKGVKF